MRVVQSILVVESMVKYGDSLGRMVGREIWRRVNPYGSYQTKRWEGIRSRGMARRAAKVRKARGPFNPYVVSPELKFSDLNIDDAIIAASWTVRGTMFTIAQGTGESDRIGRKVTIRSIRIRMTFTLPKQTDLALMTDQIRMVLYIDKQANESAASATDIYDVATNRIEDFPNLDNKSRFRILWDNTLPMNAFVAGGDTTNDSAALSHHVEYYRRLNLPILYNGAGSSITSMQSNVIGFLLSSINAKCAMTGSCRVRFTG